MSVVRHPAEAVYETYACDECGEDVTSDGYAMSNSVGTQCPHTCPNGHKVWLPDTYPRSYVRRVDVEVTA